MPRLFSAIEIPRSVAERLTLLRAGLTGARWIDPENYHLTLRFIGDVDGATARDFTQALGEIVAAPFELRLNGLGSFGGGKPRAIFAGIAPSPGLEALQRAHERAAREARRRHRGGRTGYGGPGQRWPLTSSVMAGWPPVTRLPGSASPG